MSPNDSQKLAEAPSEKKSFFSRFIGPKRGEISEDDLKKYTGMSKSELSVWAEDRPDVGKNQLAGKTNMGPASGFADATAEPRWGRSARMKHPPTAGTTEKERLMDCDT